MGLKIGIVGLPNVGKSTLFKALTREKVNIANFPFATIDPNIGIVKVPDERLNKLAEISHSQKIIPAAIEFVDIAGLVKGAYQGAGLGNQFLAQIREVDAIIEVVRDFNNPDIIHVDDSVNPKRDIETIQLELALADAQTLHKHLSKIERDVKSGNERAQEEKIILEKIRLALEAGNLAVKANLENTELEMVKNLHLLTLKPFILVFNTDDKNRRRDAFAHRSVNLDLKFEVELAEMDELEAREFEQESEISKLIKAAYDLLGLITYFTTGEDETRGWTIRAGFAAPEAGAAIHTDFKEKFIKAEVINWKKLIECGSWFEARQRGALRTEGKDYVVCDGDVMEFKI